MVLDTGTSNTPAPPTETKRTSLEALYMGVFSTPLPRRERAAINRPPAPGRGVGDIGWWRWVMSPQQIQLAMHLRDNGATDEQIAQHLHVNAGTLRYTLRSPRAMADYLIWWSASDPEGHHAEAR